MIAVFDMDDTLSDTTHRRPLIEVAPGAKKDWPEFYRRSHLDPERPWVVEQAQSLIAHGAQIAIFTGRIEPCRASTLEWLRARGIRPICAKFRAERDFRKTALMKGAWLKELGSRIICAVDDEESNLAAYRQAGLITIDARNQIEAQTLFAQARTLITSKSADPKVS